MIFFLLIWSLSSLAFIALASSMNKHQKQFFAKELNQQQTLTATIIGWLLLIMTLIICLMNGKSSNMISYWLGILTFSALFIGLCISYYSSKIRFITMICLILSLITSVAQLI